MTPEVKKRIDQIRQGIVPEGYKKTESGIIPNEWRVEQVSKCIEEYKFFSNDISHIPVYSSSRKGLVPQSDYYNQREAVETNLGYKVVPQGYVTYRHMSDDDVFHFNINKTGENVLVSSEYPVFTSSDNCDLSFLISVLNNTARFRYFCKMQKLGGTRTRLYLDNLKRYALALPPFDEQKKIAEILATQDKAIELQARKIEELKRFKKGCLEKMFPRKGQKVPEKRFPGFTDDWEQRKFEEIAVRSSVICSDANLPRVEYEDIVSGAGRLNKDIYTKESSKSGIAFHQGDVLYGKLRPYLQNWLLPAFDGLAVGDFWVLQPQNADSSFLYRLIQSRQFDEVANQSTGTKMPRADWKLVSKTVFSIPSNISEQAAIGTYFTALDNLITLHQRKLEEMKNQKKALMQLLLTGIVRV
ncbi:MAG: restriction endonuclease subunit S [Christensenellales bacterium]|nr:restriction endonuclease subunit S [Christensenellales bacterium]